MSSPLAWLLGKESPRCGCTGECGREHRAGGCTVTHPSELMVAPLDPAKDAVTPLSVPESAQGTWCHDCHDLAVRIIHARIELRFLESASDRRTPSSLKGAA